MRAKFLPSKVPPLCKLEAAAFWRKKRLGRSDFVDLRIERPVFGGSRRGVTTSYALVLPTYRFA